MGVVDPDMMRSVSNSVFSKQLSQGNIEEDDSLKDDLDLDEDMELDKTNEFLHVVITNGNDQCSHAKIQDVINLNRLMKQSVRNFKTALIQYNAKGNDDLRKALLFMAMSAQKKTLRE